MANLQVKDIDDNLYTSLKNLAKREHRSVSQEVVSIIEDYLNRPKNQFKNATEEFLNLSGSWEDDRSASEINNDIYQSRNTKERFKDGIFD